MILSFSTKNATPETYRDFIQALRDQLTAGRPTSHGIPVLPRREDVPDAQRFLLVDLTNSQGNTIRLAIDVVNAYVVGYAADGRAYLLQENARDNRPPIHTLFRDATTRIDLGFDGSYTGLSRVAREAVERNTPRNRARNRAGASAHDNTPVLEQIPMGRNELDTAISLLRSASSPTNQALGFIVIIQMLSEAARFRAIEGLVRTRMRETYDPLMRGIAMESLETHWSDLSEQIQRAQQRNETGFDRTIVLHNVGNERREVNSVDSPFVRGVAMLLFDQNGNCNPGSGPHRHDEL
ncbi:unnamed protein product [Prunus brigantina]